MKTIGDHKTPHAGKFGIAYDEIPNLKDPHYTIFIYHITAPNGQVFRIALTALRSFVPDPADVLSLVEADGLRRLKALLDSMDADGYMTRGLGVDLSGGFTLNPVGTESSNEPSP